MCKAEKTFKLKIAVILPILCLALALFATGCGQDRNEEMKVHQEAETAAKDLMSQQIQKKPFCTAITNYTPETFTFCREVKDQDDTLYEGPLFSKDWDKIKEHRLNQANVLIVEKEDGYYLKWKI